MVAAAVAMVIEHEGAELAGPANPVLTPLLVVRSSTSAPAR
jgi:hypothetical protein